jgi:putative SOS response-associated peptidase YedK
LQQEKFQRLHFVVRFERASAQRYVSLVTKLALTPNLCRASHDVRPILTSGALILASVYNIFGLVAGLEVRKQMPGRYTQHHTSDQIKERFDVASVIAETSPQYNIAPTLHAPVVIQTPQGRVLDACKWGLIPSNSADASIGSKMINARAESLSERRSFQNALRIRRCLIPADGYYEWRTAGKVKLPLYFHLKEGLLFAFAGLWEEWMPPKGNGLALRSFTLITTTPNELVAPIHDRMGAILRPEHEAVWLDPCITDYVALRPLLQPYPAEEMEAYEVSPRVNWPNADDPSLVDPVRKHDKGEHTGSLFDDQD